MRVITEQEKKVGHLLAEGLGNKQIALRMNLSESTIKLHVSSLYQKLGMANRVDLALWFKGAIDGSDKDWLRLTLRQQDIARLVVQGHTQRRIALILKIGRNTILSDYKVIRQLTGCKNAAMLGAWMGKNGLLSQSAAAEVIELNRRTA